MASQYPRLRPFAYVWVVAAGTSEIARAPIGWVYDRIVIGNLGSTSTVKVALSTSLDQVVIPTSNASDIASGNPPTMFDFATPNLYWNTAANVTWEKLGWYEVRAITAEETGTFSDLVLPIWGHFVPDPRCEC